MLILKLLIFFFCTLWMPALSYDASLPSAIRVVYPRSGSNIEASSTFIVGQTSVGSNLSCNGQIIRLNKAGFFAHVVPLHYGANRFLLNNSTTGANFDLNISRRSPPKAIGVDELKLLDLRPNVNLGLTAGDTINFSVRATPHSTVNVQFGDRSFAVPAVPKGPTPSSDVAYGKTFKRFDTSDSDLYKCSYRVVADDHFFAIKPQFKLSSINGDLIENSKFTVSTLESMSVARTTKNPTIVRLGPGLARTTPVVDGVKVLIDGWSGDNMRCLYSPNRHVWIGKNNLLIESNAQVSIANLDSGKGDSNSIVPQSVAQTINVIEDSYGEKICLPLTEKLPYQIEQKVNPNCLILKVYGVTPDTDWITAEPKTGEEKKSNLDHVSWRQLEDNVYEITAHLTGSRQWGYKAYYEDTTLCLAIKNPPIVSGNLNGIKICIDPGHGGAERGSIGCSGLPESQLNLEIASKVKACLEELGATVIMTRTSQTENPSLDDRVKIATDTQSDFLISIHNNALPDGRDPWQEHGTSSYWYHPQSIELATCLKNSVKNATGFIDLGARYQNLALARGPAMPSVLLEIGFMINPDEFAQLIEPQFQTKIAHSIADGVKKYLFTKQASTSTN
jgi:N-acetylmuramoyl-L-alanine amidase